MDKDMKYTAFIFSIISIMFLVIVTLVITHFDSINMEKKCKELYGYDFSLNRVGSGYICSDKEGNLKLLK